MFLGAEVSSLVLLHNDCAVLVIVIADDGFCEENLT